MAVQINGTSGISGVDGSASTPALQGSDSNTGISFGTDEVSINTGGTTRAKVDSSGRLGIGTTSPGEKLHISGGEIRITSSNAGISNATTRVHCYESGGSTAGYFGFSSGGGIIYHESGNTQPIRLFTDATERMRIDSVGATYFNTTAAPNTSNFGAAISRNGHVGLIEASRNVSGTTVTAVFGGNAGIAQVMGDGDLENTNNRYTGLSDARFKQNIEDASSQWDDIKAIQVRKYELIANPDRKHIGCVAQELEQVCPGLVIERENLEGESYKSVAYSVLYMKAVKALQEAMERIESLETRLAALEGGN